MNRTTILIIALVAVPFVTSGVGANGQEMSGDRVIPCGIAHPGDTYQCPGSNSQIPSIFTGDVQSVTITVTWEPVDEMTKEMRLQLSGNPCELGSEPECDHVLLQGASPLTATLYGHGASNDEIIALFWQAEVCTGPQYILPPCRMPPAGVWFDQEYHFEWTVNP